MSRQGRGPVGWQTPAAHRSPIVHGSPSLQIVGMMVGVCSHPDGPQVSSVHGSRSSQPAGTQAPMQQPSPAAQRFSRWHTTPSQREFWHGPPRQVEPTLQVEYWQSRVGSHTPPAERSQTVWSTACVQPVGSQVSTVQPTPSSQSSGSTDVQPTKGTQVSHPLHGSPSSAHESGGDATHVPAWQLSSPLHGSPSSQSRVRPGTQRPASQLAGPLHGSPPAQSAGTRHSATCASAPASVRPASMPSGSGGSRSRDSPHPATTTPISIAMFEQRVTVGQYRSAPGIVQGPRHRDQ